MDIACVLAALLFFIGNILYVVYNVLEVESIHNIHKGEFKNLDSEYIEDLWKSRRQFESIEIASSLINALAWSMFAVPILQLTWILSLGGKRNIAMHTTIAVMCLGACFTEFISLLFSVGMSNVTEWITKELNLSDWVDSAGRFHDNVGWRTVELCALIYSGMVLWVEMFEWFAIFAMLLLLYFSVRGLMTTPMNVDGSGGGQLSFTFGKCWAHLGLFISLLALLDFASQVLRLVQWRMFTEIGLLLGIINRLIFFPLWLCLLGKQLSVASNSIEMTKQFNNMHNANDADAANGNGSVSQPSVPAEEGEGEATADIPQFEADISVPAAEAAPAPP